MEAACLHDPAQSRTAEPLCPVFGSCGGCLYQDIPYEEELKIKETRLRRYFESELGLGGEKIRPITASPEPYHYRHRLDIGLYRFRNGEVVMGFKPEGRRRTIPIEACAIARREVSDFLPRLRERAQEKMPPKYRNANLVVRTGDDGRVAWGGIGRRSLQMREEDYFYTEIHGRRVYYSLDTFFQANLSILPVLSDRLKALDVVDGETTFLDLYSGVGLFGLLFSGIARKIIMIEDCSASVRLAEYNVRRHGLEEKVGILQERVDEALPPLLETLEAPKTVAMIDPPRKGLNPEVAATLIHAAGGRGRPGGLDKLLYLSCSQESLLRDLKKLCENAWKVEEVMPFDFFPKTRHLETLAVLSPKGD